jgi:hypothetical protein
VSNLIDDLIEGLEGKRHCQWCGKESFGGFNSRFGFFCWDERCQKICNLAIEQNSPFIDLPDQELEALKVPQ